MSFPFYCFYSLILFKFQVSFTSQINRVSIVLVVKKRQNFSWLWKVEEYNLDLLSTYIYMYYETYNIFFTPINIVEWTLRYLTLNLTKRKKRVCWETCPTNQVRVFEWVEHDYEQIIFPMNFIKIKIRNLKSVGRESDIYLTVNKRETLKRKTFSLILMTHLIYKLPQNHQSKSTLLLPQCSTISMPFFSVFLPSFHSSSNFLLFSSTL